MGGYVEIEVGEEMMCACYVLMMDDEAVYVGQSRNIFSRLGAHLGNNVFRVGGKIGFADFNRIRIYYCERKKLLWLEGELMREYMPKRNLNRVGMQYPKSVLHEVIARRESLKYRRTA